MTMDEALMTVYGSPERTQQPFRVHQAIALKQYLQNSSKHFVLDAGSSLLQSRVWFLRPKANIDTLELVSGWLQSTPKDPRIHQFAQKAATLVKQYKELFEAEEASSDSIPVKAQLQNPVEFTEDEMRIVELLRASMLRQRFVQRDPYATWVPLILKEVNAAVSSTASDAADSDPIPMSAQSHNGDTSPEAFHLLKAIGMYVPWDTLIAYGMDGTEMNRRGTLQVNAKRGESQAEIEMEARAKDLVKAALPVTTDSDATTSPSTRVADRFVLDDGLDAIRRDWGDLPVYVIDDANAKELDDGISIERESPSANGVDNDVSPWIHVHVADPTSLVHPRDILARHAERQGLTTYFSERAWPMLPDYLTRKVFSLGSPEVPSTRTEGKEGTEGAKKLAQPVLTFSMRVHKQTGDIVDSDVSVGWIRNIKVVSYDAVDRALGKDVWKVYKPLESPEPVNSTASEEDLALTPDSRADLEVLDDVRAALLSKRLRQPSVMVWYQPSLDIVVHDADSLPLSNPTPSPSPASSSQSHNDGAENGKTVKPTLYKGFPRASLVVQEPNSTSPSHRIVQEFMIISGIIASRFADPNHTPSYTSASPSQQPSSSRSPEIPLIYRSAPASTASPSDIAEIAALRDPETGEIPISEPFKRRIIFGASGYTSVKGMPHRTMGVGGRGDTLVEGNEHEKVDGQGEGYARVTSPLRRFVDLVNHWQLKAGLRERFAGVLSSFTSPGGKKPREGGSYPSMFTPEMLQLLADEHTHVDRINRRASVANRNAWAMMLIWRTLSSSSSSPEIQRAKQYLSSLPALVMTDTNLNREESRLFHDVIIPGLGSLPASMWISAKGKDAPRDRKPLEVGDKVKVRVIKEGMSFGMLPKLYVELVE